MNSLEFIEKEIKDKIPNNQLFCPKCGQALDWSDN